MSLKFALNQQVYVLQLHPTTWHFGYNCTLTACMSVRIASNQQICLNQLQLTRKHICSCEGGTIRYICYTCFISAVMSLCSYTTNGLVSTIAPDHQACMLQLHLTQPCLHDLLTVCMHDCYSFILSASMYITFALDRKPCL